MADEAPTTIDEAIEQAALGPKSVTVAGQNTTLPSIDELLKAKEYESAKQAANATSLGVRYQKFERHY